MSKDEILRLTLKMKILMIQLTLFFQLLFCCTGITWNSWQLEEPNMNIQALLAVSDETILVATDIGIYRINQGKWQSRFPLPSWEFPFRGGSMVWI